MRGSFILTTRQEEPFWETDQHNRRQKHIETYMIALNRFSATSLLCLAAATAIAAMDFPNAATNEAPRIISADMQQVNGPFNTMFRFCVGAGRANEGLRADWQRQLAITHRECGFKYIRMHGLLDDNMGVTGEVIGDVGLGETMTDWL